MDPTTEEFVVSFRALRDDVLEEPSVRKPTSSRSFVNTLMPTGV